MGDRFYEQQNKHFRVSGKNPVVKKPRRLKKDVIAELENLIGQVTGLEKLTIASLDQLHGAISSFINEN